MTRELITTWLERLQESICGALENADGKATFVEDSWTRTEGGGGRSRVMSGGAVIEKGGVLFSAVHGNAPPFLRHEHEHSFTSGGKEIHPQFFAAGISIVIHPRNPYVPIIHMNTRYFELTTAAGTLLRRWFGGGIDLTPHYVDPDDARYFHRALKSVCDKHDKEYYPRFRQWADDYFYLPHRNETRGIGGIFFDKLGSEDDQQFIKAFGFWKDVGSAFAPSYTELIARNKDKSYGEEQVDWQRRRRGRYVEFNLLYDKGTKFGLESGGRTESILVSLPPLAAWDYNFQPAPGSEEETTLKLLKKSVDWVS